MPVPKGAWIFSFWWSQVHKAYIKCDKHLTEAVRILCKLELSEIRSADFRVKPRTSEGTKCLKWWSPARWLSRWAWLSFVPRTSSDITDVCLPGVEDRRSTGSRWRGLVSMAVTSCYVRKLRVHSPGCHGSGNPASTAPSWSTLFNGFQNNKISSSAVS